MNSQMDVELRKSQVPAFGSWDCNDDLPFTQCFESARQAGLLRDLYVAGDLYQNDVVTPAMIVVPRRRGKARYPHVREGEKEEEGWVVCDYDVKKACGPVPDPVPVPVPVPHKPVVVDEDLYKISPDLYAKTKRKRGVGLFSCCLMPL